MATQLLMIGTLNMQRLTILLTALTLSLPIMPAFADDAAAIKARQGLMRIYAFNLGVLGNMAKGATEYDAKAASIASANLLASASLDQSAMWPAGTDTVEMAGKTAAKPEMWSTYPAVLDNANELVVAATAMNAVAGTDLASLKGAMGAVGGSCGGCHKLYRQKE